MVEKFGVRKLDTYFGDKKFLAFLLLVKEEINRIRKHVGLPEYSDEQIKIAFKNKLNGLSLFYVESNDD